MFEEKQLRILAAPLDSRKVLTKPHSHGAQYIEGWYAAEQASKIFGYGNWSRELVRLECVNATERHNDRGELTGKWDVTYLATVRVTVNGTVSGVGGSDSDYKYHDKVSHTGTGASTASNGLLGDGHEKAAKAAETDAMKRALAFGFGNQFGLSLYGSDQTADRLIDPKEIHKEIMALEAGMPTVEGAVIEDIADLIERVTYLRKLWMNKKKEAEQTAGIEDAVEQLTAA